MIDIDNLVIEVTRRCNMLCPHCLRGDQQEKDISFEVLQKIADTFGYISTIAFTGGEPSLNSWAIDKFIDLCRSQEVGIGSFYIATNGKKYSDRFLKSLMNLWIYCDDNEVSQVTVSRSDFHEDQDEREIEKIKCFRFVDERENLTEKYLIAEGRALDNFYCRINREPDKFEIEDDQIIGGSLYITVDGDIIPGCDFSYDRMEEEKVGNILKDDIMEVLPIEN